MTRPRLRHSLATAIVPLMVILAGCGGDASVVGASVSHDCDPGYEGACLNPLSADYDCEGGSGDGPDYVGTVRVVGVDTWGLDRDGDGVACDW